MAGDDRDLDSFGPIFGLSLAMSSAVRLVVGGTLGLASYAEVGLVTAMVFSVGGGVFALNWVDGQIRNPSGECAVGGVVDPRREPPEDQS